MENYIVLKDNKIVANYQTAQGMDGVNASIAYEGIEYDSIQQVPETFDGSVGQDLGEFTETFEMKTLEQRVAGGFVTKPTGTKIVNNKFVPLTLQDRVDSGEIVLTPLQKIVNNEIVLKSELELISEGIKTPQQIAEEKLQKAKDLKTYQIKTAFNSMFTQGMYSNVLGGVIDCRRPPLEDDINNIKVLLDLMKATSVAATYYRMKDNSEIQNVTQEMLQNVIIEMSAFGVMQYQKKHIKDDGIIACTTIAQVEAINWED